MVGCVVALYIAPAAGAAMLALTTAHLVPGRGIAGDRFYLRRGRESRAGAGMSDVTLVEQEALDTFMKTAAIGEPGFSARRNIVIRGCALHQLVGRNFCIGGVMLQGLSPHRICASAQTEQQDACTALTRATLWAQVVTAGDISLGDRLQVIDQASLESEML
jgi:MOSC domain-containing protein YiiM